MEDEQKKKPTLAIFEFQWNLTNIPDKTGTILSKMVEFREEKIFRAGLKNQSGVSLRFTQASSTLLFMTTDFAKMGLRAETVLYNDNEAWVQWFPKTLVPPLLDSGSQDTGSQGQ